VRSERERRTRPMEFDEIYAVLDDTSKGKPKTGRSAIRPVRHT